MAAVAVVTPSTARSLDDILKENAALQAEIDALKGRLGISTKQAENERAKVLQVFTSYDVDRDGAINTKEFEAMANSSGLHDVDAKQFAEVFASIKKADPSRVTFDEFYVWFQGGKLKKPVGRAAPSTPAEKLQAKTWAKVLSASRRALRKSRAAPAPPGGAKAGAAAATSASAGASRMSRTRRPELVTSIAPITPGVHVRVQVGDVKEVATAIRFAIRSDADAAAALRRDVEAPADKRTFVFVDMAVIPGADEGRLGELAGVLEGLVTALGQGLNEKSTAALGAPVYNGHSIKIATDKQGRQVLRIILFVDVNPTEVASALTGHSAAVFSPEGLFDLAFALETPLSFAILNSDDQSRITLDRIHARVTLDGAMHPSLDRRAREACLAFGLGPEKAGAAEAAANFLRGLNIDLASISLQELANKFPDPHPENGPRGPGEALKHYGGMLPGFPLKSLVNGAIGDLIRNAFGGGDVPAEVRGIYELVRGNINGPSLVHVQVDNTEIELSFQGFDIFPLLPPLP